MQFTTLTTKIITGVILGTLLTQPVSVLAEPTTTTTSEQPSVLQADEVVVKITGDSEYTRIKLAGGQDASEVAAKLELLETVAVAEPNYYAKALGRPNDMYYSLQWNLHSKQGGIYVEDAWNVTDGSGIVVAVVDSGVAYETFGPNIKAPDMTGVTFTKGYDFVNRDNHPNDDHGHGTHIASTIAGDTNNFMGTAGVAPGVTIMPIKVLDHRAWGSYSNIAAGIRYAADNGADVINLSLGGYSASRMLEDAVAYAHAKGAVVIAATGNDNFSYEFYPARYDKYVIAVGATDARGNRSPFSNYGNSVDILAPGGNNDIDANGDGYVDGILAETLANGSPANIGYYFFEGTSMAAAHVSGAAALILASKKASTHEEVQTLLQNTADDLGSKGRDSYHGYGMLNLKNIFSKEVQTVKKQETKKPEPTPAPKQTTKTQETKEQKQEETKTTEKQTTSSKSNTMNTTGVVFQESFESGLNGWSQDRQKRWKFNSKSREGRRGVRAGRNDTIDAALISPTIDVRENATTHISFSWMTTAYMGAKDYGAFDVSFDGGATWTEKARVIGGSIPGNVWVDESIIIANAPTDTIQLRFRATTDERYDSVYLDHIVVSIQ